MSTPLKSNERKKLSYEDVKKIKEFENLSEAEAEEMLTNLYQLAYMVQDFMRENDEPLI